MPTRRSATIPTIRDVAQRANVSPMTVSRVINGSVSVHPDTRARILVAIRELGYTPPEQPREGTRRNAHTIGLILPNIGDPFFTKIALGVEQAANNHDYRVIICNSRNDIALEKRYLSDLIARRVDGIIIAPSNDASCSALHAFSKENYPIVLIDREIPNMTLDVVQSDNQHDAVLITQHLISLGHRQIAFISGDNRISTSRDRLYGYRLALDTAGIPFDSSLVFEEHPSQTLPGYESAHTLLQRNIRPDAIMAINAMTAMGVVQACNERQLRIPHDIALISFDDLEYASVLFPFFTVMEQPTTLMGETAVNRLLLRIHKPEQAISNIKLPSTFIERRSCGSHKNEEFFRDYFAFR
ncbi:MAG: LacI family transcriptional regulator [Chloroflexi bacterium]|nr:MAG: LacI family transcriptional regulator [Chloroflexota bacterium]